MSWRKVATAWAGPMLIVAVVLFGLRGFVFHDRLTNEQPDILAFWLPRWAFLGRSLAAGHLPLWNPFEMTGYRFAADPQSGWLYAPPMLLFSTLPAGVAMRAMIALQPLLAGLALYGFLRIEGLGRAAATIGAMVAAGLMVESEIAVSMPFSGTLAWTAVTLLAAAGYARAGAWAARLRWIALGGFAWSQIASAHLSHGLVIGTVLVAAYLVVHARGRPARWLAVAFLVSLPLLSIAVVVPRFQFLHVSSLGHGYDRLGPDAGGTPPRGQDAAPIAENGGWMGWPFEFAAAPGAYAGAAALLAAPLAFRARRHRQLVIAAGGVFAATWSLLALLGFGAIRTAVGLIPFGDVLLHNPARLRYAAVLALPILAAAGIQGLVDDPPSRQRLWIWMAAGAMFWIGVPAAFGAYPIRWALLAAEVVPAAWLLGRVSKKPTWAVAIVGFLAIEIAVASVLSAHVTGDDVRIGLEAGGPLALQPLRAADVQTEDFLRPTPFVATIGGDRYLTWAPPAADYEKGYLFAQEPTDWPALANERGTLFGIRDTLGYNPVQLPAYWTWMRAHNPLPMFYNAAVLARPSLQDLRTLGVRYLIVPSGVTPPVPGRVVQTAQGYDLVEVLNDRDLSGMGRVSIVHPSPGTIRVQAGTVGAALPVDEAYDPGWTGVADGGRPVTIAPNGPEMVLRLPPGVSAVTLTYRDPWVVRSLWAGAGVWLLLGAAIAVTGVRQRRRRLVPPGDDDRTPSPGRTAASPPAAGSDTR